MKLTTVLGLTISATLLGSLIGCANESGSGDETGTASTTAALSNEDCDTDDAPSAAHGVHDPGVRGGPPGAGGHIDGLDTNQIALFNEGLARAQENEATCNGCQDLDVRTPVPPHSQLTNSSGLGARYNDTRCMTTCHSQPNFGGSSPAVNPSFEAATMKGANNVVPWFEKINGPTREVRFLFNADGSRDGGVHQKFSTRGRSDVSSACTLGQPDFSDHSNMIFRIPTPIFGAGLMDALFDKEILSRAAQNANRKSQLGIHGVANHSGNDGTITKFGWKAQNKSLFVFSGEAYAVEMGVTSELNPTQKVEDDNCGLGAHPNDVTATGDGTEPKDSKNNFNDPLGIMADWMMFSLFMEFTAPPEPAPFNNSAQRGEQAFKDVGCNECHSETMHTKAGDLGSAFEALRDRTFHPYSDMIIHHMGSNLADNVNQGGAGPDQFRSAPLWGVGKRLFFLHDGRADSLVDAIMAHYSTASKAHGNTPAYPASEANQVVKNFANLPASKQQDIINFLRAL